MSSTTNTASKNLLEVEHLTVRFDASTVVNDVSFNIAPGEKIGRAHV